MRNDGSGGEFDGVMHRAMRRGARCENETRRGFGFLL
jgi:hypothetical protein